MIIGDTVKITGGNNEVGQPTMIGKTGIISSFGITYKVKEIDTIEVFVDIKNMGTHVFNDLDLKKIEKGDVL